MTPSLHPARGRMKLLRGWLIVTSVFVAGTISKAAETANDPPHSIESKAQEWRKAVHSKRYGDARVLCQSWLNPKSSKGVQTEALKCLANVELATSTSTAPLGTNDIIVGPKPPWYLDPGASRAIKHLTEGIALSPDDITIHQGRLHVVSYSQYRSELPQYLKMTLKAYPRPDGVKHWLAYCEELATYKDFDLLLAFLRVLENQFPDDSAVQASLSWAFSETEKDTDALRHAQRAAELDPRGAENVWRLGMIQRRMGNLKAADDSLGKAIELQKDAFRREDYACDYALFIREKLKNHQRACELERRACPTGIERSCVE